MGPFGRWIENAYRRAFRHGSRRRLAAVALAVGLLFGCLRLTSSIPASGQERPAAPSDRLHVPYRYIGVGWIDLAAVQLEAAAGGAVNADERFEPLLVLGMAHEAAGRDRAAASAYERAVAAGADAPERQALAYALLGLLHLRQNRPGDARIALETANRLLPGKGLVLFGLGEVAEEEGSYEEALGHYVAASEVSPDWLAPVTRAASIHNRSGRHADAARLLAAKRSLGSSDLDFHFQLGLSLAGIHAQLGTAEAGTSPLDDELIAALGLDARDLRGSLVRLVRHAADRALQLSPGHAGAEELLESFASDR